MVPGAYKKVGVVHSIDQGPEKSEPEGAFYVTLCGRVPVRASHSVPSIPSSDGLIVVEAAPREVVLLALGLLRTGRALGRGCCCAGGGDALVLAAGCGVGFTLDAGLLRGGRLGVWDCRFMTPQSTPVNVGTSIHPETSWDVLVPWHAQPTTRPIGVAAVTRRQPESF